MNARMIAPLSFLPGYCPNCGHEIRMHQDNKAEFWHGVSMQCLGCGIKYQFAPAPAMLACASLNGDLAQYATEAAPCAT